MDEKKGREDAAATYVLILRNREARSAGHVCPQSWAAIGQGGQCRLPPNKRKEES